MTSIKIPDGSFPFKVEWLRSFVGVVESGGFTTAARGLHLSQPAVSNHVKDLEARLGTRLFEHVGTRVRLTRSGEAVLAEARRILEGVRALRDVAGASDVAVQGVLKVGASTTPGNYILPSLMGRFERKYPKVKTRLAIGNTAKIVDLLRANDVDVGVVGYEPEREEFVSRPFRRDEIVLFASRRHPLARRRSLRVGDLSGERLLVREAESATRRLIEGWLARQDARPAVMELGCPETLKRLAAEGLGLGLLSRFSIEWEVSQGRLAELRAPGLPVRRWLFVVYHRRKHLTPTIRSFLALLHADG